jgi:hypothetical protein
MKCPICGKEGSENLVVITTEDKKVFPVCSYEHGMILLHEFFRLKQPAAFKERIADKPITVYFDEVD